MKKLGKFLFGTLSLAAAAGGVYCLYKNRINKDADFDDFDEDEEEEDEELNVSADPEDREYVSITITSENNAQDAENTPDTEDADPAAADTASEEPVQTAYADATDPAVEA